MNITKIDTVIFSEKCTIEIMSFVKEDTKIWKEIFDLWYSLKIALRKYKAREPNLPEGLSEIAFCLWSGSSRFISAKNLSNTSFDTFNTKTNRAEQIKACSVQYDLTSFGPKSKWDDLYFLDFYNNGNVNGIFDIYKIDNKLIYDHKVNKNETLKQQQEQKRRPRFSLKRELILKYDIKPLAKSVQIW